MKIALFQWLDDSCGEKSILEVKAWQDSPAMKIVRISEIVDVQFVRLNDSTVIEKQLAAIDKQESELREKFQVHLNELNARRSNLMALTHTPEQA